MPILRWALGHAVYWRARQVRGQFERLCQRPTEQQHARLLAQIRREERSGFGRDHGFGGLRTAADFRRRVPIAGYEAFHPYIERMLRGDADALTYRQRPVMYALTSGTTATRKHVPVTPRFLKEYRRGWLTWGVRMFDDHPELWFKGMLQLVGDWQEEFAPSGVPCGSISGLTSKMQFRPVRQTYVMPPETGPIKESAAKYYLAWRVGLARDVAVVMAANPSTTVALARFGNDRRQQLVRDLHDGTLAAEFRIPDAARAAVRPWLKPNPRRAKELDALIARTGALRPKDAWPTLKLLCNWTGGSVSGYMRQFPEWYGDLPVRDLGLIASEGRMTIPLADNTSSGALDLGAAYFEFLPVGEAGSAAPVTLEAAELEEGQDYFILLTTSSGFYRYHIHDVVRCTGWHGRTPMLAFLNKGANFSSLTGEKISEHQVVAAAHEALAAARLVLPAGYALAPMWDGETPAYGLFVEAPDFADDGGPGRLATAIEAGLRQQNMEYAAKRDSGRLLPLRALPMPAGAWAAWDARRLARNGGTPEQYKRPVLIADTEFWKSMPAAAGGGRP